VGEEVVYLVWKERGSNHEGNYSKF
jgi:hypothetical protein